jgi:hypothetical protein
MFVRTSKWVLVAMLTLTLGFHWTFLQSVAWVGMVVNYSRDSSLKAAFTKTFDGQHPCCLCKLVQEGKKSEKKSEAQPNVRQFDLFAGHAVAFYFPLPPESSFSSPLIKTLRAETPPSPPPRQLPG